MREKYALGEADCESRRGDDTAAASWKKKLDFEDRQ